MVSCPFISPMTLLSEFLILIEKGSSFVTFTGASNVEGMKYLFDDLTDKMLADNESVVISTVTGRVHAPVGRKPKSIGFGETTIGVSTSP